MQLHCLPSIPVLVQSTKSNLHRCDVNDTFIYKINYDEDKIYVKTYGIYTSPVKPQLNSYVASAIAG